MGDSDEIRYHILKALEQNPQVSQRELAKKLGVSLGKVNYCLKALVDVGLIKIANFARCSSKLNYIYVLTPSGIKEKTAVTLRFLRYKQLQFEKLEKEIAAMKQEL